MVKKFFYFPMITVTLLLTSCTNVLVHDMEKGGVDGMAIDFRTPALTRVAVESFTAGSSFSVWGWYLPKDAASEVFNATTVSKVLIRLSIPLSFTVCIRRLIF